MYKKFGNTINPSCYRRSLKYLYIVRQAWKYPEILKDSHTKSIFSRSGPSFRKLVPHPQFCNKTRTIASIAIITEVFKIRYDKREE